MTATRLRAFDLSIEQPLALAKTQEVALLRRAVAANPKSVPLRSNLALLLFIQDEFPAAIDLYESLRADNPSSHWSAMLSECYISLETADADRLAEFHAREAALLAADDAVRSRALAALGKALTRQGKRGEARQTLVEALERDPHEVNAYKRLAALDLDAGATAETLALAEELIANGVGHARLFIARGIALAKLGRIDESREAVGIDRYLKRQVLKPPMPWRDLGTFNAAIRAELERHPDLRFDRYGTASSKTWRIDQPAFDSSVAVPALQSAIRDAIHRQIAELDRDPSPWTNARPEAAVLHNWCVLTDAEGYEQWHVHQGGWMSGVYYVDVPPAVTDGRGDGGCIMFGLPDEIVGRNYAEAFGRTLVRPSSGLLMTFPSHTYHRTFAHGSNDRRICVAFDIKPL